MNAVKRLILEYGALARSLPWGDSLALIEQTVMHALDIFRTGKLAAVDAAMSRNMAVRFDHARLSMPLAEIDRILAAENDSPSFGNVREIFARNCYLRQLRLKRPLGAVLDLGANRGIFSLLALVALDAGLVVGVEPTAYYLPAFERLLEANHCQPERSFRYTKFISSPSREREDPVRFLSIQSILTEQKINRFELVKMDIEGDEEVVFSEPEWLASVENLTMELHPELAGDLSLIPQALQRYGFTYRLVDQAGKPAGIDSAMFLYASRVGALCGKGYGNE
jgi:hypothetical protein